MHVFGCSEDDLQGPLWLFWKDEDGGGSALRRVTSSPTLGPPPHLGVVVGHGRPEHRLLPPIPLPVVGCRCRDEA
eukprot:758776-Hanusia_phi.AAC.4